MTRLSTSVALGAVVLLMATSAMAADELGGINDRFVHFTTEVAFEQWERHEGAWEEEGEFERRAVRWPVSYTHLRAHET